MAECQAVVELIDDWNFLIAKVGIESVSIHELVLTLIPMPNPISITISILNDFYVSKQSVLGPPGCDMVNIT